MNAKQFKDFVSRAQKFQEEADRMGYGRPSKTPIGQYPHCDQKVLHAPGECEYCDAHPDWQELREVWMVNYTGHDDPRKTQCPAEQMRPREIINRWGGNVSTEHVIQEEEEEMERWQPELFEKDPNAVT